MRTALFALLVTTVFSVASVQAQDTDPAGSSYSSYPRRSRFELTPAQQYVMMQARADFEHKASLLRYYDNIGFDYGQPRQQAGVFYQTDAPIRYRRYIGYSGRYVDYMSGGF